ncbi:hypothetical protein [Leuconostoc mesenteroides]|uniref:hypothetical protein n=1 Tax=Leuconostoc mesenteroides TaxID=1245 RepID=UPI00235F40A9|nr:hypothetical protein [Leuconostoc mesenteroides]
MTGTVVHVTTLEQWKSVLDVWYKQGHYWLFTNTKYQESIFDDGGRYLFLDDCITYSVSNPNSKPFIEYSEFMAQQKEDNKMTTVYEVSQSVFDELQRIKAHEGLSLIGAIVGHAPFIKFIEVGNKAILRYLADDPAIEFKVKEQLYRLYLVDVLGQRNYFTISNATALPDRTVVKEKAFVETLEEIKKWQTPAWEIEEVQHGK